MPEFCRVATKEECRSVPATFRYAKKKPRGGGVAYLTLDAKVECPTGQKEQLFTCREGRGGGGGHLRDSRGKKKRGNRRKAGMSLTYRRGGEKFSYVGGGNERCSLRGGAEAHFKGKR